MARCRQIIPLWIQPDCIVGLGKPPFTKRSTLRSNYKYIAFDIHQATTVVSVLNAAGREVKAAVLPTQAQLLLGFLQGLRGKLHLTLEKGTSSAWLYDLPPGRVEGLVARDPGQNALLKEGNKSEAGDAHKLAGLLRAGML